MDLAKHSLNGYKHYKIAKNDASQWGTYSQVL